MSIASAVASALHARPRPVAFTAAPEKTNKAPEAESPKMALTPPPGVPQTAEGALADATDAGDDESSPLTDASTHETPPPR